MRMVFLAGLIDAVTEKGRRLLALDGPERSHPPTADRLFADAQALLTSRGEASLVAAARSLLDAYAAAAMPVRLQFLRRVTELLVPDPTRLDLAIGAYTSNKTVGTIQALHEAAEPRRQELMRRLNLAASGTLDLVRMREDVLEGLKRQEPLHALDADFLHLFSSWFNRGFLVLHRVDWATPANILERIIRYEAVHEIQDWDDLRSRLEPHDRRCFAFFHPRLVDEPLIFVEVALTRGIPDAIAPLLDQSREPLAPSEATTAVFYSISNCQLGLSGVSFGNFLIKQVVEELRHELPNLEIFATLSPLPGFMNWLAQECRTENSGLLSMEDRRILETARQPDNLLAAEQSDAVRRALTSAAAAYLLLAKNARGRPLDAVARFHLGNGARLERINWLGDPSAKGLRRSAGLMVNYLYDLDAIVENHEAYANHGVIAASAGVKKLIRPAPRHRNLLPLLGRPPARAVE